MRKLINAIAITAVSGLTSFAASGSAAPISGWVSGGAVPTLDSDGLVQKVHGWHCRKRYGWYRGREYRHRHWQACDGYYGGCPGSFFGFYCGNGHDYDRPKRRKKKDKDN
jgi:hypothetical protein